MPKAQNFRQEKLFQVLDFPSIFPQKNAFEVVSADTSALESEIDRIVYHLYGLTDEEIKIVEGVE